MSQAASLPAHSTSAPGDVGRLGMWIFLATEILFFGGLLFAYLYGRTHWPQGFAEASRHTHVGLGTLNTALLLTSSALVALAVACAEQGRAHWTPRLLAASAVLGLAFLAVKGIEYREEWHEALVPGPHFALQAVPGAALFFLLYFVMTGLHALHLLIGVAVLGSMAWGRWRQRGWAPAHRVEVAGLYWHFVDVVWIFLYPLIYLVDRHP